MNLLRFTTVSLMAAIAFPAAALALNPQDFADKLSQTILDQAAVEITFNSATAEGDTIILSDWNIPALGKSKAAQILDRTLTFTGVSETADGGYTAQQASVDDIDFTKDDVNLVLRNVVFNNISLPGDPANDVLGSMLISQGMSAGPLVVNIGGTDVFRIDSIATSSIINADQSAVDGSYKVTGIYGDLSQVNERDAKQILTVFGITELNARMDGSFSWNLDDGNLIVNESSITIDNIGKLNVTLNLLGYTLDVVKQLQASNKELAGVDPTSSEYQTRSLQMLMGVVTRLSFNGFGLRFDDDSITDKVIAMLGEQNGMSRQDMIDAVSALAPAMMADVAPPELIKQVVDGVTSFIKSPQSIEIVSRPKAPLPFLSIMTAAQDPSAVLDMLNVSVQANQEAK